MLILCMRLINIPQGKTFEKTRMLWETLGYNVEIIYDFTSRSTQQVANLVEEFQVTYPKKLVILLVE